MKLKTATKIRSIFDITEEDFPEKSTEFLMELTCQKAQSIYGMRIDHGDVAEAIQLTEAP